MTKSRNILSRSGSNHNTAQAWRIALSRAFLVSIFWIALFLPSNVYAATPDFETSVTNNPRKLAQPGLPEVSQISGVRLILLSLSEMPMETVRWIWEM